MFENPDFEVNKGAEEYRLLNPVLSRFEKTKLKRSKIQEEPIEVYIIKI